MIDTKAILARADEALAKRSQDKWGLSESATKRVPQLAADVRALVAEVEKLTNKLSNVHANLTRAEEDRDDALTWIERYVDQTRRAELAEARVKELEARHISDCEHAKIIQGANEKLSSRINELGDWFHEQVARAEKAEARLAVAVRALSHYDEWLSDVAEGGPARDALAKVREGQP